MWFLNKLFDVKDQPVPRFAFQGTVNWMRALALFLEIKISKQDELRRFYSQVKRRNIDADDILAFECLLMAIHNLSSLSAFSKTDNPYTFVRSAIISWYYANYYSSKAMLASATGANPQTHAKTGRIWQIEIVDKGLIPEPFNFSIKDLTPTNIQNSINFLRGNNPHNLNTSPKDQEMALGAIYYYL